MAHPMSEYRSLSIALVSETFPPEINGVAMTLGRLVDGLAQRGHHVQVVRCRRPGETPPTTLPSVTHLPLASLPIPRYQGLRLGLPARGRLRTLWTEQRPDLVHVATEGPLGRSAQAIALELGIPHSSSFHTNFDDYARHYRIGWLRGVVARSLMRFHNRARLTMVPSIDLIDRLRTAGYQSLVPLGRGVDTKLFDPALRDQGLRHSWGAEPEDQVYIHVGRVAPEKDIPLALEAFRRIRAIDRRARMVVVGDGPLRKNLAQQHPDVLFTGALPVNELARHYASADVFLFPSQSETFGNVLLEACASGLTTVSFDYAAPKSYITHDDNGLLAPFGDQSAWLSVAESVADDRARCTRLRRAARTTAETIGWDAVIDRFEGYVRQVVDAPASQAFDRRDRNLHRLFVTPSQQDGR